MNHKYIKLIFFFFTVISNNAQAQYTAADTLRGTNGINRKWWNITKYEIMVEPNLENQSIGGEVFITFDLIGKYDGQMMQIDMQQPMQIDSFDFVGIKNEQEYVKILREGNIYKIARIQNLSPTNNILKLKFSGTPRVAKNAPWDGGLIWKKDKKNNAFVSVACQELGASVWYPCKDIQSDEPDSGASITIITPENLQGIGNGKLINTKLENGKRYNTWQVVNPINNYNIVFYIGKYVPIQKTFIGKKGKLECTFWAIAGNEKKAEKSFDDIFIMLAAFEKWFGPFPWYQDGYQLVEAPHLGMEHQSAIAYGNKYKKGYLGKDLSGTGWGLQWDYIIIHESGHEWWGNHVTTNDIADMWIHEGFTTYSEALFVEEKFGKKAGEEYVVGLRKNIANVDPLIGDYGVNKQPTGDIYYKGANILHMIRTIINDDEKWKRLLQEIQKQFGNKTSNSADIEHFICRYAGINFMPLFGQYLYTNQVPKLNIEWKENKEGRNVALISVSECNENFEIPYFVPISETEYKLVILKKANPVAIITELSKSRFAEFQKAGYYLF
jgi:aminopeptidase N